MSDAAERRRAELIAQKIAELDLSGSFDLNGFLARLEGITGRPVRLRTMTTAPGDPSGLLLSMRRADYIVVADHLSPILFFHTFLHESGHLLLGHAGADGESHGLIPRLLPSLPPTALRRVFCRTNYGDEDELMAELFATTLAAQLTGARPNRRGLPVDLADLEP